MEMEISKAIKSTLLIPAKTFTREILTRSSNNTLINETTLKQQSHTAVRKKKKYPIIKIIQSHTHTHTKRFNYKF